jgi:hypothetical protein
MAVAVGLAGGATTETRAAATDFELTASGPSQWDANRKAAFSFTVKLKRSESTSVAARICIGATGSFEWDAGSPNPDNLGTFSTNQVKTATGTVKAKGTFTATTKVNFRVVMTNACGTNPGQDSNIVDAPLGAAAGGTTTTGTTPTGPRYRVSDVKVKYQNTSYTGALRSQTTDGDAWDVSGPFPASGSFPVTLDITWRAVDASEPTLARVNSYSTTALYQSQYGAATRDGQLAKKTGMSWTTKVGSAGEILALFSVTDANQQAVKAVIAAITLKATDPPYGWATQVTSNNTTLAVTTRLTASSSTCGATTAEDTIAGHTLGQIVNDAGTKVRGDNCACQACHGPGKQMQSWNAATISKQDFCDNRVTLFSGAAKPQILKDLFNNWKTRNCPD